MDTQAQIAEIKKEIEQLKRMLNKNQFSNLFVFDEMVQFKSKVIFPKDETAIATSTTDSTGRIAFKDAEGNTRYLPYFA